MTSANLVEYFDRIPQARAATRMGPVRSHVAITGEFHCEVCGIHTTDEQHRVTWRSRLGRCSSMRILESDLHAAREHGAELPDQFKLVLARLHRRYPRPSRR